MRGHRYDNAPLSGLGADKRRRNGIQRFPHHARVLVSYFPADADVHHTGKHYSQAMYRMMKHDDEPSRPNRVEFAKEIILAVQHIDAQQRQRPGQHDVHRRRRHSVRVDVPERHVTLIPERMQDGGVPVHCEQEEEAAPTGSDHQDEGVLHQAAVPGRVYPEHVVAVREVKGVKRDDDQAVQHVEERDGRQELVLHVLQLPEHGDGEDDEEVEDDGVGEEGQGRHHVDEFESFLSLVV